RRNKFTPCDDSLRGANNSLHRPSTWRAAGETCNSGGPMKISTTAGARLLPLVISLLILQIPAPTTASVAAADDENSHAACDTGLGVPEAPAGAVVVDPGTDLSAVTRANPAGTTFWLSPGTHLLAPDQFGQVIPKDGDVYLGAPGAVLDGQRVNQAA